MEKQYYTVEDVVLTMNGCITKSLIYSLIHKGKLPALRLGRRFVIKKEAVFTLLDIKQKELAYEE